VINSLNNESAACPHWSQASQWGEILQNHLFTQISEDLSFACHANGSADCSGLFSGMSDDG
jgi:hypothetical protein